MYCFYMLPLRQVIGHHISFHCYADDTQLYLSINPVNLSSVRYLGTCLAGIKSCVVSNFFMFNTDKTEVVMFGPKTHREFIKQVLSPLDLYCAQHCTRDQIFPFIPSTETFIQAFVYSHLLFVWPYSATCPPTNKWNGSHLYKILLPGFSQELENMSIFPVLASLHWLPTNFRMEVSLLVFKAQIGLTPH